MAETGVDVPDMTPSWRRRFVGGGLWALSGEAAAAILAVVSNGFITRLLEPAEAATYFLVNTVTFGALVIAQAGIPTVIMRLVAVGTATGDAGRVRASIRTSLRLGLVTNAVVGAVFLLPATANLLDGLFPAASVGGVAALVGALLVVRGLTMQRAQAFRGWQDYRAATILGLVAAPFFNAIGVACLWIFSIEPSVRLVVAISAVAWLPALVASALLLRRRLRPFPTGDGLGYAELRRLAWPLTASAAALYVNTQAHFWIVGATLPASDVARYGATLRLINVMQLLLVIVASVANPMLAHLNALGRRDQVEHLARGSATAAFLPTAVLFVVLLVGAGPLLGAVFGPFYAGAGAILVVLAAGHVVNTFTGLSDGTLVMCGHERWSLAGTVLGSTVSVAAALLLVGPLGVIGPAVAFSAGLTCRTLFSWVMAKRLIGVSTHAGIGPLVWEARRAAAWLRDRHGPRT